MTQKSIREYDGKKMLASFLEKKYPNISFSLKTALVTPKTIDRVASKENWMKKGKLVAKPDELFGKRGKLGLILVNASYSQVKKWISAQSEKLHTIKGVSGKLTHFLVEPFVPHKTEYYVAITSSRHYTEIFFSTQGGIDIEEQWGSTLTIRVPTLTPITHISFDSVLADVPKKYRTLITSFIKALYEFYVEHHYAYLEINPFVIANDAIVPLDFVARIDALGQATKSGAYAIEFPGEFGFSQTKEEQFIEELDSKTGSSLKLKILNPHGRIWTMVAGGGASVIYADTVADLGHGKELANYGEYSGDPSEELVYQYAKTLIQCMTKHHNPKGKVLIIGGGIANFTDVEKTFAGIIRAITEFEKTLKKHKVTIYVRRGGPNYKKGLAHMDALGKKLSIPIHVFGPETGMTEVVPLAAKTLKD